MRILHTVEFYAPSVGGAQEVVKQISERLVMRDHVVTVATTKLTARDTQTLNGVRIEEFAISRSAGGGFTGETDRYRRFLLDGDFDVMLNYAAQQWATDLVFPVLERLPCRKVLAPCGFSGLYAQANTDYFAKMPSLMHRYDHLVFHSNTYRDIEFARAHGLIDYSVIPNGASEEEFAQIDPTFRERYHIPQNVPLLITVGSHTSQKGHRLVLEAFRHVHIGRTVLIIIGNVIGNATAVTSCLPDCKRQALLTNVVSLGRKQVFLLNPPRADVVAAYHAADLFVFGSPLECSPLVLFEAMASRTPYVTTGCGNAAEITRWCQGGVVLPTRQRNNGMVDASAESMARAIEDLVGNPGKRNLLAEAGYEAWRRRFTWEKIVGCYEQLYRELCERPSADTLRRHGV
jgi:glycosyltransferase involved in cell wall biosynthesis